MFRSAALKLTVWYLAIIMALSAGLSLVIYRLSRDELINNTRRQVYFFNDELTPTDFSTFARLRQRQLDQGLDRLRADLLVFNLLVLTVGGAGSYFLARRTLRPIEDSLEAQKRFTADASHELRTPLTAMQTETEVALRDKALTKAQAIELLGSNLEEVAKLKALSEGLLKLAAEENKRSLRFSRVSLKDVALEAKQRWDKIAQERKISIKTSLADLSVQGDRQSLVDLVSILLDNAIKYSPPASTVSLKTYKKERSVFLSVSDRGQGIKAYELPKIFDRFYRTDESRTKSGSSGYGLGLAIAKKIADLHGGSIEVKSAPEKGSTFSLQFPSRGIVIAKNQRQFNNSARQ